MYKIKENVQKIYNNYSYIILILMDTIINKTYEVRTYTV